MPHGPEAKNGDECIEIIEPVDITEHLSEYLEYAAVIMNCVCEELSLKEKLMIGAGYHITKLPYNDYFARRGLHEFKTADVSRENMQHLDEDVLDELTIKYPIFKQVYNRVRTNGEWNLKKSTFSQYKDSGVLICGQLYDYDVTGNFDAMNGMSCRRLKPKN